MFRNPTTDLIVVLVIVLLILGPKRLPGLGKSLGQGMREFKEGITGEHKDEDQPKSAIAPATAAPESSPDPRPGVPAESVAPPAQPTASPGAGAGSSEAGAERRS